jgi:hypothetical protein
MHANTSCFGQKIYLHVIAGGEPGSKSLSFEEHISEAAIFLSVAAFF